VACLVDCVSGIEFCLGVSSFSVMFWDPSVPM